MEAPSSQRATWTKARENGYKLDGEMFHLDIRNKLFTLGAISLYNNLTRNVVNSPSLELFKL